MSKYRSHTVAELVSLAASITEVLQSPAGQNYPVDTSAVASLGASGVNLHVAANAQDAAMIAAKEATNLKGVRKEEVADRIATIQAIVTASPHVTDTMLVALGFPPRRSGNTRPKLPAAATGLTATPDGLGNVAIKWLRGDASHSTVTYLVETSLDAGASWSLLDTTRRASIVASNFSPGIAAWFRVTATAAAGRAQPSAPASIYAPTPAVSLKLAA